MTKKKVKCPNGHEFYMEDYERKACPKCGRVVVGEKADSSGGGCLVATACARHAGLPDDCNELNIARSFRDTFIRNMPDGKGEALIDEYYKAAPEIIDAIDNDPNRDEIYHNLFNQFMENLDLINSEDKNQAYNNALKLFDELKQKYLN